MNLNNVMKYEIYTLCLKKINTNLKKYNALTYS